MSALHSVKKNIRPLTPLERKGLDRAIVRGTYHNSRREIAEAKQRLADDLYAPKPAK